MNSIDKFVSLYTDLNRKLNNALSFEITSNTITKVLIKQGNKTIISTMAASINVAVDLAFAKLQDYKKEVLV